MKTWKNYLIYAGFLTTLLACKKDVPSPGEDEPNETAAHTEYIVGYVRDGIHEQPAVWKDGELTVLPFDNSRDVRATQVAVGNGDTYILGRESNPNGFYWESRILLWKNDELIPITDGTTKAQAIKMVVQGSDVYILGSEVNLNDRSSTVIWKYWKNGQATSLNTETAHMTDMAVVGNDIYVCGYENNAQHNEVAKLWKNGVAQAITGGEQYAIPMSIATEGNDVAVLYTEDSNTGNLLNIWQNSQVTTLNAPGDYAQAFQLLLHKGDTHVLSRETVTDGSERLHRIFYRKNEQLKMLDAGSTEPCKMLIHDDKVYILAVAFDYEANEYTVKLFNDNNVQLLPFEDDGYQAVDATDLLVTDEGSFALGNMKFRAIYWHNGAFKVLHENAAVFDIWRKNAK